VLQASDSTTSLPVVEKEHASSTGRPKKLVAATLLCFGASVSTGAGITSPDISQEHIAGKPWGDFQATGRRTTTNAPDSSDSDVSTSRESSGEQVPTAESMADAVRALRVESGLTWDQLGRLFGVSRRAMHLWANGGRMNAAHAEALSAILQVVRNLPDSGSIGRRNTLLSPSARGYSIYDQLRDRFAPDEDWADSGPLG
jgi:DNA-binding transcriptional regulator YiaG